MNTEDVVIVAAARTPQGRLKGQLAPLTAVQLGSTAIRGALAGGGIAPEDVDAVLIGQVLPAGAGQNPARQAAVGAGIPWDVHSGSVNKVCLSGLTAIIDGARMIAVGDATVVVAAGMESMTRAPHLLMNSREGWTYGSVEVLDHMAYDGLTDAYDRESMGASTERHNERLEVTREMQDAVAARSHQRAARATDAGVFAAEIVPVEIPQRKGDPLVVTTDEGIRPETTVDTLGRLRAAFAEGGSITAGNSSQISDGASATLICSAAKARELRLTPIARYHTGVVAGSDPVQMLTGPIPATEKLLRKTGLNISDIGVFEVNEAFACVPLAWQQSFAAPEERLNPLGGAIAVGHPLGASGTVLMTRMIHHMRDKGIRYGLQTMCEGGGTANATVVELV